MYLLILEIFLLLRLMQKREAIAVVDLVLISVVVDVNVVVALVLRKLKCFSCLMFMLLAMFNMVRDTIEKHWKSGLRENQLRMYWT
jgi:hypothetical protein